MTIPRYIADYVEIRDGAPIGINNVRVKQCIDCRALTYVGLDNEVMAFLAHTDITPISSAGELAALLSKRRTYLLERHVTRAGIRFRLTRRDSWIISGNPPQQGATYDVVAEHVCGLQLLDAHSLPSNFGA